MRTKQPHTTTVNFKWFLNFVLLAACGAVFSQTTTENYIYSVEPRVETASVDNNTDAARSVQYYDGLGRPKQSIAIQSSPLGKDIVVKTEYDAFGRQVKDYLPVPATQNNGSFIGDPDPFYAGYYGAGSAYNTDVFYSEKEPESSPLNRVLKQAAPGNDWQLGSGHEIKFDYRTNSTADNVRMFQVSLTENFVATLNESGYFPEASLYKTVTTDENGHTMEEYRTKLGQVILKRIFEGSNTLDTYYIYDNYDNLSFVIPPLAAASTVISEQILNGLCYQYRYNNRNLLTEKRLPGKGKEYMVYDKQDRLVATQDANLRANSKWLFTKYDRYGRVVYTGLTSGTLSEIRSAANSAADNNNEKTEYKEGFVKNGLQVMYLNNAFPTAIDEIFTVNYYDDYGFEQVSFPNINGLIDTTPVSSQNRVNIRGTLTASMIRVLGTDTWEKNYYFYDSKLRVLYSLKKNHLGGETTAENEYNFRGLVTKSTTTHKRTDNAPVITVVDEFTYSPQERLLEQTHKVNQNPKERIAVNQYDELGQLTGKEIGGQYSQSALQQVDYRYNIRGWLTGINDTDNLQKPNKPVDLFAFRINYNDDIPSYFPGNSGVEPLYNGNIAETYWRTASDNKLRGYGYSYDELNRLKDAFYQKPNLIVPLPQTFDEYLSYDLNGNITSLQRYSGDDTPADVMLSDDLQYTYTGNSNLLVMVSDSSGNSSGFSDGTNTNNDYTYDSNGNMTRDRNKGITSIIYNHLNLPAGIIWNGSKKIEYLYNAAGVKVQKKVTNGASIGTTDYLDGFQYNEQLLEFFPHAEGYVKVTALSESPVDPQYAFNYVYNYTDHLGNIRVSYAKDPQTGNLKILDESHYYPFGLKHQEYANFGFASDQVHNVIIAPIANNPFKYRYNSKEFQDELGLSWYDYGARNYDPAIGRWINIDPMAPKYFSHSTYAYALNAPSYFIDPDGMQVTGDPDEENPCENGECEVVILEPANIYRSKLRTLDEFINFIGGFSMNRLVFGADGLQSIHKAYENMNRPENKADFMKMQQAKREGEWFAVGILSMPFMVAAAPEVIAYGSIVAETWYGSYIIETTAKIGMDATAQYLITGDVNWLNAAAGSVLPGNAGYLGSPILSEGADVLQYEKISDFNFQKSSANVVGGYLGSLSGFGTKAVSSDWSSSVGSFIFSNGVQSFHTQGNTELIKSNSKN